MEIVTCLACGGDESLLVCNEKECGLAVHEKCLPCSAYFDASGSFYCPRCSYELAVEECSRAKKHASLAKQALLKFISAPGGNDQQPEVEATNRKQSSPSTSERDVCHLNQAGGVGEKENSVICKRMDSPNNLLKRNYVNDHRSGDSLESEKTESLNVKKMRTVTYSSTNQGKPTQKYAMPTKNTSMSQNCNTDKFHTSEAGESGIKHQAHQSTHVGCLVGGVPHADDGEADEGMEGQLQMLQESGIPVNPGLMKKCLETEMRVVIGLPHVSIAIERKRHTDEILEESSERDELFVEDSDISDSDIGTTSTIDKKLKARRLQKEKRVKYGQRRSNDSDFQNGNADESVKQRQDIDLATSSLKRKFSDSDKRGKMATPTKTRRRKQWSDAEVEILKEGVQKFSVPNTKMPWGRILEFGSHVFEHYRTAVDLKDKWRNLTK